MDCLIGSYIDFRNGWKIKKAKHNFVILVENQITWGYGTVLSGELWVNCHPMRVGQQAGSRQFHLNAVKVDGRPILSMLDFYKNTFLC